MVNVIWKQSPNYTGNLGPKTVIVIHWWGNPADKPSLVGTVNWLCNPAAKVSAHYVISGNTVYQLVDEKNVAWHARDANPFSIGIEVDPNTPPGTYETLIPLCREIAQRHQMNRSACIKAHRDYVNTQCPGNLDLNRIRAGVTAEGGGEDMTIIIRPISMLKVHVHKQLTLYNLETGKPITGSGSYMELTGKSNIVRGASYLIPVDRMANQEPFGFLEHEVMDQKNQIHDTQFDPLPVKEVIKEVPVEVVKEIIKEVPVEKEVIKEVVKEVPVEVIKEVEVIREVKVPADSLSGIELIRLGLRKWLGIGGGD